MKALHSMEGALEQLITGDREDAVMDSREDCPGPAGTPSILNSLSDMETGKDSMC